MSQDLRTLSGPRRYINFARLASHEVLLIGSITQIKKNAILPRLWCTHSNTPVHTHIHKRAHKHTHAQVHAHMRKYK